MIKLNLVTELNQSDAQDVVVKQFINELGEIADSKAIRVSKGNYMLTIQDAFKNSEVFCRQNKMAFNTVGMPENTFLIFGNTVDDSTYQIQTLDLNLFPWEDSLGQVPFELIVIRRDFVPQ